MRIITRAAAALAVTGAIAVAGVTTTNAAQAAPATRHPGPSKVAHSAGVSMAGTSAVRPMIIKVSCDDPVANYDPVILEDSSGGPVACYKDSGLANNVYTDVTQFYSGQYSGQISYTYGPYGNETAISFGPYQQYSLPGVDAVVGEQIN